jgi:hypothetical protein
MNRPIEILVKQKFTCLFLLLFGATPYCGGNSEARTEVGKTAQSPIETPSSSPASTATPAPGMDDEIVPLFNPVPPALAVDRVIPEDPAAFRRQLQETLKTDQSKDVLPMIDVALLLNPHDMEMREARADILLKQGLSEDAAVDLEQCCKGGRPSCCR